MIKNYFKIAIRNLLRNKGFTLINITGLVIGLGAALVIFLIVHYEFSYENFQSHLDDKYRVTTNMRFPDADFKNGGVPGPLPAAIRAEVPGIQHSTFIIDDGTKNVSAPNSQTSKTFRKQKDIALVDSGYFSFISYEWIAGNASTAMLAPNQVVLTESRAKTYFNEPDISKMIGRNIIYDDTISLSVSGIVKDLDETTDFTFREFVSLPTYLHRLREQNGLDEWGSVSSSWQFFVQLKKGIDPAKAEKQIAAIRKRKATDAYLPMDHFMQPLSKMHFDPDFDSLTQPKASLNTLYGLLAVAAFLLLLACINFINLTTAQSAHRAREIGIRKTMGSSRKQVITQFLIETFLLTTAAALLAIALTPLILKVFADFIPAGLSLSFTKQPQTFIFLLLLLIVVSIGAGFYPAIILSKLKPVTVLKNATNHTGQSRDSRLRKVLTVSQFVIAQFLIIATLVVVEQLKFALKKEMGFRKEAIINFSIPFGGKDAGKKLVLLNQLNTFPGIEKVSLAGPPPASTSTRSTTIKFNKGGKEIETTVDVKQADHKYFELYQLRLLAGRFLTTSDTLKEYMVNESYARFLGYDDPAKIIGQRLNNGNHTYPIVGVLADFNPYSVAMRIKPLIYISEQNLHSTFHIALPESDGRTNAYQKTISRIENAYEKIYPDEKFNYSFFDDSIAKFYKKERDASKLLSWSAGLAILISCLGMLGLVVYTTTQRIREIGVRKVLGASVTQIVSLLSKNYLMLVLFAFVIAAPLGWLAMHKWLEAYAYKIDMPIWVFLVTALGAVIIAMITVSFQAIKAAIANPVKSLRTE